MKVWKTLVVDDEPLARQGMTALLAAHANIQIVGTAGKVTEVLAFLEKQIPDVIFLDIQLFGKNAFDLLPNIPAAIQIIFVTAYDSYALRAFEVNALDYLLKPVHPERLATAIKRLTGERVPTSEAGEGQPPAPSLTIKDQILMQSGDQRRFVPLSHIRAITADGEYSEIHPDSGGSGLLRKSLKTWESELPEHDFSRIHRNAIVNFAFVEKIEEKGNGCFHVFVKGFPRPFESSRRMSGSFEQKWQDRQQLSSQQG